MIINLDLSKVSKINIQKSYKKLFIESGIKMMNLSLEELMVIAKLRKVKDCKYNSKDEFKKNTQ